MYVVLEGIGGAGKTTQARSVADLLSRSAYTAISLFEPTYGPAGRRIRDVFETDANLSSELQHELLTMDRLWHVRHKITPVLRFVRENPSFVLIQERCYLSAPAYQASTEEEMLRKLREQQEFSPKPDLILLLDLPSDVAFQRLRQRGEVCSKFERDVETLEACRRRYLYLASEGSESVAVVDANQPNERVSDQVLGLLDLEPYSG